MFHIDTNHEVETIGTYVSEGGDNIDVIAEGRTHAGGLVLYVADPEKWRSQTDSSGRIMDANRSRYTPNA